MPCLNEAETLATCIRKAKASLESSGVEGEIIVADNGSTDGSREIAVAEGARLVPVARCAAMARRCRAGSRRRGAAM